jgi:hypothetical protein
MHEVILRSAAIARKRGSWRAVFALDQAAVALALVAASMAASIGERSGGGLVYAGSRSRA